MALVRTNCLRACVVAAVVAVSALAAGPVAEAASGGTSLTLGGAVSGTLTSAAVVCNSPVASSKHKFLFDLAGTASTGARVVFGGAVEHYTSPKTYNVSARIGHLILTVSGRVYSELTTGTITVGAGAHSASVNISLRNTTKGLPTGKVTVKGHFTCTATSKA